MYYFHNLKFINSRTKEKYKSITFNYDLSADEQRQVSHFCQKFEQHFPMENSLKYQWSA